MPEGAQWCVRCWVPARPEAMVIAERARERAEAAPVVYSRTQAGVSSFGLKGRIAITVATLAVLVWLLEVNPLGAALWLVVGVPLILRDTWKRTRIR